MIDAVVVGGGPAGVVAALRLHQLGHRVRLVHAPGPTVGLQSLSPGVAPVLADLGLGEALAGWPIAPPGWVLWETPRPTPAPHGGRVVERRRFDAGLRAAAARQGLAIDAPRRMEALTPLDAGVRVSCADGAALDARVVVLATGRGGPAVERHRLAPRIAALVGLFHAASPPTGPLVEATPGGWAWAAPAGPDRVLVIGMVDPATVRPAGGREARLRALLADGTLLGRLARAPCPSGVHARDATSTRCRAADPPVLRVGDAALTLDPSSSSGVERALRGGLHGALAAHTLLVHPERAASVVAFLDDGVERAAAEHAAWTAERYGAAWCAAAPFWAARAAIDAPAPPPAPSPLPAGPLLGLLLRRSPAAARVDVPRIEGEFIVEGPALRAPGLPRPVAFVEGVPVAPLWAAVVDGEPLSHLVRRWPVPPAQALRIAGWMLGVGLLAAADARAGHAAPRSG